MERPEFFGIPRLETGHHNGASQRGITTGWRGRLQDRGGDGHPIPLALKLGSRPIGTRFIGILPMTAALQPTELETQLKICTEVS